MKYSFTDCHDDVNACDAWHSSMLPVMKITTAKYANTTSPRESELRFAQFTRDRVTNWLEYGIVNQHAVTQTGHKYP